MNRISRPSDISNATSTGRLALTFTLLALSLFLPGLAGTATSETLYQTSFEPPAFTLGLPIRGQDNWEMFHEGEAISVSTNHARTGTQCLRFNGALLEQTGPNVSQAYCFAKALDATAALPPPLVEISTCVRLDGPRTGIDGSPANDLMSANFSAIALAAGQPVRLGAFVVSSAGKIFTVGSRPEDAYKFSAPMAFGVYHKLALRVDFVLRTLRYFVNDVELGSVTFAPSITPDRLASGYLELIGPTEPLTTPYPYNPADYTAYFDDYSIVSVLAPIQIAQQAYLKASNTQGEKPTSSGDEFGGSVAASGDTVVVGALFEDSIATGVNGNQTNNSVMRSGAAYVFVRNRTNWTQQAYLKAFNTGRDDKFGGSVAVSGDTIVVGAPGEASNATGVNGNHRNNTASHSGAAYVFVRNGTNWSQQAYLKASNSEAWDSFGTSLAIFGDTLVIGAPGEDSNATGVNGTQSDNSAFGAGAAYVFVRDGTNWTQQAYLKASTPGGPPPGEFFGNEFGFSVAISENTIMVGAPEEDSSATGVNGDQDDDGSKDSGAAYVFTRTGVEWSQQAYLKASNPGAKDRFGISVAVSGDTTVVGANQEDSSTRGVNGNEANNSAADSGAAYVFIRVGTNWTQEGYLKASNTGANDWFGRSVTALQDIVVVGAPGESSSATGIDGVQDNNSASGSGAAYVFSRVGTDWLQQSYLKPSNSSFCYGFGQSLALSDDTLVAGAYAEFSSATGVNGNQNNSDALDSGAAYVFTGLMPSVPGMRLLFPERRLDGLLQLSVEVEAGRSYTLQASDDLANWTDLTTQPATTDRIQFTDTPTASPGQRFYRVKQE